MNVIADNLGKRVAGVLSESLYDNPVVLKEFRTRMRGWKAFTTMGGYILLLAIVMSIAFASMAESTRYTSGPGYSGYAMSHSRIGMDLFQVLIITQVVLLTLVLPSLTAGSVSGELERKTIDMLALTNLNSSKIILGKHLSGFLYALMLLVCSVPLAGLCLMLGGLSPAEMIVSYCIVASWAFMITAAGVMWSSIFNKTAAATAWNYGTSVGYMFLSLIFSAAGFVPYYHSRSSDSFALVAMNPAVGPYIALNYSGVCGMHIPVALVSIAMEVLIGMLLMMVAGTHIKYQRVSRAWDIRVLYLIIGSLFAFLFAGSVSVLGGTGSREIIQYLSVLSGFTMVLASLNTIAFSTGPVHMETSKAVLLYGFNPIKGFQKDIRGATFYTVLWTAAAFAALALGFIPIARSLGANAPDFWMAWLQIAVASLAVVGGISAIGIMISSAVKNRKTAIGLMITIIVLIYMVYTIILAGHSWNNADVSLVYQFAALWPITAIISASNGWDSGMPKISWSDNAGIVVIATYLIISGIALSISENLRSKGSGIQEDEE